jgi:hypothetical protein
VADRSYCVTTKLVQAWGSDARSRGAMQQTSHVWYEQAESVDRDHRPVVYAFSGSLHQCLCPTWYLLVDMMSSCVAASDQW